MGRGIFPKYLVHLQSQFTILQSNFFPAKFFISILEKGILAGKNLLCKEGFSFSQITSNLKFSIKKSPNPPPKITCIISFFNLPCHKILSTIKINYTPRQNKKDWRAQKWDYNYWKVHKITRILMYILTPREFGFQRNLDCQFPPFWIQISRKFRKSSMKFCYALWNSTLKKRFSLWHLRFD